MRLLEMVDSLVDLALPDDPHAVLGLTKDLITLRNATEHQLTVCAAVIDESGIARTAESTTSKLLQANGAAPVSAYRWLRIGAGITGLDRTAGYSRDGFLSSEHVDAVVKGVEHIAGRSEEAVTAEQRIDFERKLLSHAISGSPPAEIGASARALGNDVAKDAGGPPPAEDRTLNGLDYTIVEGRLVGKFDLDAAIGEKMFSALDFWSRKRPEPDGSDDSRTPAQRRADALHQLLDCGGGGQTLVSAPRTEVMLSVPAHHPNAASLPWMTLDNGCLLCRTCHMAVHHTDWDVIMGSDRHPWLIPPADIDPQRRPLPAYNRRTLTLVA